MVGGFSKRMSEDNKVSGPQFTFYCLVKNSNYAVKPHIHIYSNMIEIINWK